MTSNPPSSSGARTDAASVSASPSAGPAAEEKPAPATPAAGAPAANADRAPARTPPAAPAAARSGGLSSVDQVTELADQLSSCADQLHERIMREIRGYQGGPVPDRVQATMRKLLADEILICHVV